MPGKRQRTEAPSKRARKPDTPSESSGSGSEEEYGSDVEGGNDQYLHSDSEEDEFEGLATYEVDDWDGAEDDEESGTGSGSDDGDEAQITNQLQSIPLASLAKAQRSLKKGDNKGKSKTRDEDLSNEERIRKARKALAAMRGKKYNGEESGGSGDESESDGEGSRRRGGRPESRSSKHAPQAISTKHQVSRTRQIVPLSSRKSHDPRFLSTTGNLDSHLHAQSYDFLPGMLAEEMKQLRTSLVAAQKLEKNCPLRDKPTRTAEREAIERDVARLRTKLDKQKRETREREVMADVKREERKKREEGKGAWYMKKGEKRDLLLKARFDALQSEGKTALKKAMDRKRKKVAGKEKKSRPNVRRAT